MKQPETLHCEACVCVVSGAREIFPVIDHYAVFWCLAKILT